MIKVIRRIGLNILKKDRELARFRAKYHIYRAMNILGQKQKLVIGFVTKTAVLKEMEDHGRTVKSRQKRIGTLTQRDSRVLSRRIGSLKSPNQEIAEAGEYPEGSNQGAATGGRRRDRRGELDCTDHQDFAEQVEYYLDQGAYGREVGNGAYERDRDDPDPYEEERGVIEPLPEVQELYSSAPLASRQMHLCQKCSLGYTNDPSIPCPDCQERESRKRQPTGVM